MDNYIGFDKAMGDEDYGIVVGKDGVVKGIWIPKQFEDADVPDNIVGLCIKFFGVDPNSDSLYTTVH